VREFAVAALAVVQQRLLVTAAAGGGPSSAADDRRADGRPSADQSVAVPVPGQQEGRGRPRRHDVHRRHSRAERDHQPTVPVTGDGPPDFGRRVQTSVRPGQRSREPQTVLRGSVRVHRRRAEIRR